jgi:rod shape-determining protein MreC
MKNHKFGMIVTFVAIILIILISFTSQGRETVSSVEGLISKAMVPVQKTIFTGSQYVKNFFGSIIEIGTLKETNKELEEEVKVLKQQQVDLETIKNENERLTSLLNYQKNNPQYDYIVADIVSIDPEVWFNVFVIDKGSKDGIQKNMAVSISEGLVGKVVEVASGTSKVLAISDIGSMVNGVSSRTGDYIRIQGSIDKTLEGFIDPDAKLIPGDIIVTSGLGGIYPDNIIIGEVESVIKEEGMLEKTVIISPAVDFKQLNEVFILKKK